MARRPLVAGNWKMNGTRAEARSIVETLLIQLGPHDKVDIVICPPFTALSTVGDLLANSPLSLGAQDVFWEDKGAWTGQVSSPMLSEIGCKYVLVGHSERRGRFGTERTGETDALLSCFGDNQAVINKKLLAVLAAGMTAICCVGETKAERDAGRTDPVIIEQVESALVSVGSSSAPVLVFAYEPVWAIGTGSTCPPEEASRLCGVIRAAVGKALGSDAAETVRILYGGGETPENAPRLHGRPDIDGALIGGASLHSDDFAAIVHMVAQPRNH